MAVSQIVKSGFPAVTLALLAGEGRVLSLWVLSFHVDGMRITVIPTSRGYFEN